MRQPSRILIIKLCCIGDVIFLTPTLRALRQALPDAHIAFLGSSWVKDVLANVPYIDQTILFDAPYRESKLQRLRETFQFVLQLRRECFDTIIVAHRTPVFATLGWLAGIKTRVGFSDKPSRFLTRAVPFDANRYEVNRYLDLVSTLGIESSDTTTHLAPRAEDIASVAQKLTACGIEKDAPLVGLFPGGGENPGTSMPIKRWYPENYAALCRRLAASHAGAITLLGGPTDKELNASIQSSVSELNTINLAGEFSLRELPALMQRCRVVVGGDTGPLHMAAAVGTPTVFLFGPSDPRLVAPTQPNSVYLWKQPPCSPCYTPDSVMNKSNFNGKDFGCRTGTHECLRDLGVEDVYAAIERFLARA